jgi:hypothetical protein
MLRELRLSNRESLQLFAVTKSPWRSISLLVRKQLAFFSHDYRH